MAMLRHLLLPRKRKSSESLLVHGASGAVGLAAVQMAVAKGCFVVGSAGSPAGEAAVAAAGAQFVVNHKEEGYLEAAKGALPEGSGGFDVVLENAAQCVPAAAPCCLLSGCSSDMHRTNPCLCCAA